MITTILIAQVVASSTGQEPPSETPRASRTDGLEESVAKHISTLAFKLALSKDEQELLAQEFDRPKPRETASKQPLLISYHDDMTRRLTHLKPMDGFNPMKAELAMQGYMPLANISSFKSPIPKEAKERAARLQELITHVASGALTQHGEDCVRTLFVMTVA